MKPFIIALLSTLSVGIVACSDIGASDGTITLDAVSLEFEATGGTQIVNVTSGVNWKAVSGDRWIAVAESEGKFTVSVPKNNSTEQRTGTVTVKNADDTKTVTVTQKALDANSVIKVNYEKLTYSAEGSTKTVTVTTGLPWTVTKSGDADWMEIEKSEDQKSFDVTVTANTLTTERKAIITVDNGITQEEVSVVQNGADGSLAIDSDELFFTAEGGTKTLNVTCSLPWEATMYGEGLDWIRIEPSANSLAVIVAANTTIAKREANITFLADGKPQAWIYVAQNGTDVNLVMKSASGIYLGDFYYGYYGIDAAVYTMQFWTTELDGAGNPTGDGHLISLEMFSEFPADEQNPEIASGTYTVKAKTYKEFIIIPGYAELKETSLDVYPSYVGTYNGGASGWFYFITEGTMQLGKSGGNYNIDFDFKLDSGTGFKATYNGPIDIVDESKKR